MREIKRFSVKSKEAIGVEHMPGMRDDSWRRREILLCLRNANQRKSQRYNCNSRKRRLTVKQTVELYPTILLPFPARREHPRRTSPGKNPLYANAHDLCRFGSLALANMDTRTIFPSHSFGRTGAFSIWGSSVCRIDGDPHLWEAQGAKRFA